MLGPAYYDPLFLAPSVIGVGIALGIGIGGGYRPRTVATPCSTAHLAAAKASNGFGGDATVNTATISLNFIACSSSD